MWGRGMIEHLKTKIQNYQIEKCQKQYEQEVMRQTDRYGQWLSRDENNVKKLLEALQKEYPEMAEESAVDGYVKVISYDEIAGAYPLKEEDAEILVFVDAKSGFLAEDALNYIAILFRMYEEWDFVYGDEDYSFGERKFAPWMKPDWSPDTLMAFPYIGRFFAVRRKKYEEIAWLETGESNVRVYDFQLKCSEQEGRIVHVPKVLYHHRVTAEQVEQYGKLKQTDPYEISADDNMPWLCEGMDGRGADEKAGLDEVRLAAMERRGYPGKIVEDDKGIRQPIYDIKKGIFGKRKLVSIVIPSKDNLEVLERCIRSVKKYAGYPDYEIIVVDNGSIGSTRAKLMLLAKELSFDYHYKPMEFNFSAMVNYGVHKSSGDYILLLNDDCEVIQEDWLVRMLGQAQLPHVGAVGAKLLYPDSDLIQHAGVTNMSIGPGHKLQRVSDGRSYYYGKNRFCYNYVGVTAACLLVSKGIYEQVGGFDEDLKVAFNDVAFCFSLIEAGYYNVMRNDVVLYHHESLSRGNDLMSEEKTKRLMDERDMLYKKHPQFRADDPFYSKNLLGNAVEYAVDYRYPYETEGCFNNVKNGPQEIPQQWYNDSIYVTLERAGKKLLREVDYAEESYFIEGWGYVLNQDNSRYEMSIFLRDAQGKWYESDVYRRYRTDVVKILPAQQNIALSGFVVKINAKMLPTGEYKIYLFMKDRCSRQRLLKDTGAVLKAE